MEDNRPASLSWFVVSTRDYKKEYDWIWDKIHHCCYSLLKAERTDDIKADLAGHYVNTSKNTDYYEGCVLMPELQDLDISGAAEYLRTWCDKNHISYTDDLEKYEEVERYYWGYDS